MHCCCWRCCGCCGCCLSSWLIRRCITPWNTVVVVVAVAALHLRQNTLRTKKLLLLNGCPNNELLPLWQGGEVKNENSLAISSYSKIVRQWHPWIAWKKWTHSNSRTWSLHISTMCFTDLDKLNLLVVIRFEALANFSFCPSSSRNHAYYKSGQNWLKNIYLATLIWIGETVLRFNSNMDNG